MLADLEAGDRAFLYIRWHALFDSMPPVQIAAHKRMPQGTIHVKS